MSIVYRVYPYTHGRVAYEPVPGTECPRHKNVAGWADSEAEARAIIREHAGDDVTVVIEPREPAKPVSQGPLGGYATQSTAHDIRTQLALEVLRVYGSTAGMEPKMREAVEARLIEALV